MAKLPTGPSRAVLKKDHLPADYVFPARGWISVDPGEVHVGVAFWTGEICQWTKEFTPTEFEDWLIGAIEANRIHLIAYEIFMLYQGAELGRGQSGSTFPTCELIGVMKHLGRRDSIQVIGVQASAHKALYRQAEFKPPQKPLRAWKSYGHGAHCKDAENIGIFVIRRVKLTGKGY